MTGRGEIDGEKLRKLVEEAKAGASVLIFLVCKL
jgi:hypothetical protein